MQQLGIDFLSSLAVALIAGTTASTPSLLPGSSTSAAAPTGPATAAAVHGAAQLHAPYTVQEAARAPACDARHLWVGGAGPAPERHAFPSLGPVLLCLHCPAALALARCVVACSVQGPRACMSPCRVLFLTMQQPTFPACHAMRRWVRHPGYMGWAIWAVGTQLLLANPACTLAFAAAVSRAGSVRGGDRPAGTAGQASPWATPAAGRGLHRRASAGNSAQGATRPTGCAGLSPPCPSCPPRPAGLGVLQPADTSGGGHPGAVLWARVRAVPAGSPFLRHSLRPMRLAAGWTARRVFTRRHAQAHNEGGVLILCGNKTIQCMRACGRGSFHQT